MPPFWDALFAVGVGLAVAAALVTLFALTGRFADRRADRHFAKFLGDLERQGEQPWNSI